jgi:pimeloyl-ACP methyl ester carboxylesterase
MRLKFGAGIFLFILLIASFPARAQNQASLPAGFVAKDANVDGLKLHYTMGGHGPAVVLLHGFAETSRMWTPILPVLGEKFMVIAPDLPGIGDSSIPANGIDMKAAAISIHSLVRSLGIEKARVVGHDIGLMVAYGYAAQFPAEVEKLVVMDAFLPGVEDWEPIYNNPSIWHFRFNGPKPEALVTGREAIYFSFFWDDLAADRNRSLPQADRLYRCLFPARAHESGVAIFRVMAADRQGFCGIVAHQADHASAVHRWRKVAGKRTGPADEVGGYQRHSDRPAGYRPLDPGRAPQGNHRRAGEVSIATGWVLEAGHVTRTKK